MKFTGVIISSIIILMNPISRKVLLRLFLAVTLLACTSESRSAMVSLSLLGNSAEKLSDPAYQDGESMMLRTTSGGQTFTLSAANYGEDELATNRWGLIDASKPWNRGKEGALLQFGFDPSAVGSTKHTFTAGKGSTPTDIYASYVSLKIDKSAATMFTSIKVDLVASTLSLASTAWAGTSADNFTTATTSGRGGLNAQGRSASWDFANLNYASDAPLEIRIYGLSGADSALIKNLNLQVNAVPIPEASTGLVCGLVAVGALTRRRRISQSS